MDESKSEISFIISEFLNFISSAHAAIYDNVFKSVKEIHLKTDNTDLFNYSIDSLTEYGYTLTEVSYDLHNEKRDIITTDYEDKFVKEGKKIAFLIAYKKD